MHEATPLPCRQPHRPSSLPRPACRVGDIEERLATTELFMALPAAAHAFQAALHGAPDLERLLPKAAAVLAGVVERVAAAEEADAEADAEAAEAAAQLEGSSRWAPAPLQHTASSKWAAPSGAAQQQQRGPAERQVAQLASALDLSQVGAERPVEHAMDGRRSTAGACASAAPSLLLSPALLLQAAFLPVVHVFEGCCDVLQALHALHSVSLAARGSEAALPPPLRRAVARGEAVAGALQQLMQARAAVWCRAVQVCGMGC